MHAWWQEVYGNCVLYTEFFCKPKAALQKPFKQKKIKRGREFYHCLNLWYKEGDLIFLPYDQLDALDTI